MPTIVTEKGRISVPKTREVNGTEKQNMIMVKASGWVKYRKDGEFHHIPPNQIIKIEETDPDKRSGVHGGQKHPNSLVSYQSPNAGI